MDRLAMAAFVDRVVADAMAAFGRTANPAVVEQYALEAVLDLWLTDRTVTGHDARQALRQIRLVLLSRGPDTEPALAAA